MSVLSTRREGTIAVVTLDNPPVNAVSEAVRKELVAAADAFDADPEVGAVILICAGRTFIAGADVREFDKPPEPPHLPEVVDRLERASKPWIAAIHGSALGGGLEIAMGCRFRVARSDARVGLPEVTLGIVPGASGTVRTPRLAGVETAIELASTGKPMPAPKAAEAGLIDRIVNGDLEAEAIAFAREAIEAPLPAPASERPVEPVAEEVWSRAREAAAKPGHQSPLRALDLIRFATEAPFDAALARERETFLELRGSQEAAALRHVFFAERAAPRPEAVKGIDPLPLNSIGIVGGGTMGAGIAAACLNADLPVVIVERDQEALDRGVANVSKVFDGSVKRGKLSAEARDARMARVTASTSYSALGSCDLVVEAVFEEIGVKREVFAQLGAYCRADAILATNTSYLDPREIALGLPRPDRFLGLHFFSPAHLMKLLEIVPAPETSPETLSTGFALARRLGKIPVRAGICEGFIGNRMLKRYRSEAEALVMSGVPIAEVDAAMRAFGFRMGPFEAQDLGGLDIAFLQREGAREAGENEPETLGDILVRAGRKGQKTSGGWYDYREGERTPQPSEEVARLLAPRIDAKETRPTEEIAERLVGALAAEGEAILSEGIADSPEAIDLVQIHGYGFPRWKGGPMFFKGR